MVSECIFVLKETCISIW